MKNLWCVGGGGFRCRGETRNPSPKFLSEGLRVSAGGLLVVGVSDTLNGHFLSGDTRDSGEDQTGHCDDNSRVKFIHRCVGTRSGGEEDCVEADSNEGGECDNSNSVEELVHDFLRFCRTGFPS